jgi:hypothetical protein
MGIAFVLVIWGAIWSVLAGIGSLILRWVVAYFTRGVTSRRGLLRVATFFPVACLAWAGTVFVFQAVVNVSLLHRDVGLGDGFDCPLPNGYALTFIDVTDIGTLYNPKNRPVWSDVRENAVNDVRIIQLAGPYVLGGSDTKRFEHFGQEGSPVDSYFLLDTRTGKRTDFKTYGELGHAAQQLKVQPRLVPIDSLYSKYRFTWFDAFAGILLGGPPLIGAALLTRWTIRLRRTRVQTT